jgi:uncharacterized caspase-like protein
MKKVALLIGVSEYETGFTPLPGAVKDAEAMRRILQNPDMGRFDSVTALVNPDLVRMQEEIEKLFDNRNKEDLVVLYFSGHGLLDESGKLYFASHGTRKLSEGAAFSKATAVPAGFIHEQMSTSRSQQKVVILDCCFSEAFVGEGLLRKDDGSVDVQSALGNGVAIMTSSTSTQYSIGRSDSDLSIYTHYLVKGIESGEADLELDGKISIEELHDYVKRQVSADVPSMQPQIYSAREGYKIVLAHTPVRNVDVKTIYGKEFVRLIEQGEISVQGRKSFYAQQVLTLLKRRLRLFPEEINQLEKDLLKPYFDHYQNYQIYRKALHKALQARRFKRSTTDNPVQQKNLLHLQQELKLNDMDVEQIRAEILASAGNRIRWRQIALAALSTGTTLCIAAASVVSLRMYEQWHLPASVAAHLDTWNLRIRQTRFQIAQGILGEDSLETALSHVFQAEQAMNQAQAKQGQQDSEASWLTAIQQFQAAINLFKQPPNNVSFTTYQQYLMVKKSEADRKLYANAIAPALQAQSRYNQRPKSLQDWKVISALWAEASARMYRIPKSSSYYEKAQHKATTYQGLKEQADRSFKGKTSTGQAKTS